MATTLNVATMQLCGELHISKLWKFADGGIDLLEEDQFNLLSLQTQDHLRKR